MYTFPTCAKKLKGAGSNIVIKSIRGQGYKMIVNTDA
jgi:hypothetical protein